jgi:hypothetical protein
MIYLLAVAAGLAGAVVGWAVAAALAYAIATLAGVTDFEGARATIAVLFAGPVGGFLGLGTGIWLALRRGGRERLAVLLGKGALVLLAIGAMGSGGFWYLYETRPMLGTSGSGAPRLDFELRLPAGAAAPADMARVKVDLGTERNQMPGSIGKDVRRVDDRVVLAGSVELAFRSRWRLLTIVLAPGAPSLIFQLPLSARPSHMPELGPWQRVTFIADGPGQPRPPTATESYELRTRVVYRDRELEEEARRR